MSKRVVLAMSGGVDSSVAASILKDGGYDVLGLFMRTGSYAEDSDRRSRTCCSISDAIDARKVADILDIPFYVLDFEEEFGRIKDYFAEEYRAGRTPNPCVMCNIWLKFGKLWAYGKKVGADHIATGHYARMRLADDGSLRVARAHDRVKDQSYVLFGLIPELMPYVLFPVGDFPKAEIRAMARARGLPVHDKTDSQEICFVPDDDYLAFVHGHDPGGGVGGQIVDEGGQILGQHAGVEAFTIGQRRGLGIAVGEPRYVIQIEPDSQTITVGKRQALERQGLLASRFNWQGPVPSGPHRCLAQIRAQHQPVPASVEGLPDRQARVVFDKPQIAVAPGQVVVVYDNECVLGGGWIDQPIS